jgi:hypothetical protein
VRIVGEVGSVDNRHIADVVQSIVDRDRRPLMDDYSSQPDSSAQPPDQPPAESPSASPEPPATVYSPPAESSEPVATVSPAPADPAATVYSPPAEPAATVYSAPAESAEPVFLTPPPKAGTFPPQPAPTAYSPPQEPAPTVYTPQEPTAYAQPTQQQYAPPQQQYAAPTQQQYAPPPQYPAPAQPPKKKRRGWLIALIVILLGCCLVGSIVAAVTISAANRKAEVDAAMKATDAEFDAAGKTLTSVEEITKNFDSTSGNVGEKTKKAAADGTKKIDLANAQVKKARAALKPIAGTETGMAYEEALKQFEGAIRTLKTEFGYLNTLGGQAAIWINALDVFKRGFTARNDAITNANGQAWDKAEAKANESSDLFKKAQGMFLQAHKLDPAAGLDAAAAYSGKRKEEADLVKRMISDGRAGRTSAYNTSVDKLNAMSKQIESMKEPQIFTDPNWVTSRMDKFTKEFEAQIKKAETAYEKAHTLYKEGKY